MGLLGAAILPQLDGRGVSGTAVRGPTPVVGDCLDVTSLDVPDRAAGPNGEHQLPTGSVGSCTNDSAGQLVGVVYDRTQVVLEPEPSTAVDPYVDVYATEQSRICDGPDEHLIMKFVGGRDQVVWTGEGGQQVGYLAARGHLDAVLVASPGSAGRPWIGCVLASFDTSGTKPFSAASGHAADQLGACNSGKLENHELAPCGQPHTSELLGTAYMKMGATTRSDFEQACRAYAVHRIGADGPVISGEIRIEVDDGGNWEGGDCRVSVVDPARTLSGTVVGIGDSPLPWTP